MKQNIVTMAIVAMVVISAMAVVGTSSLVSTALAQKVTDCHNPPGNPDNRHEVTTGEPSVESHVTKHGDYLGPCIP